MLLGFQLLAAAAALVVTAWAALRVRPLLAEREQLSKEIAEGKAQLDALLSYLSTNVAKASSGR